MEMAPFMRRSSLGLLLATTGVACSGISETRTLPSSNPTEWTYAKPLAQVSECLKSGRLVADRWGGVTERSYLEPNDVRRTARMFETVLDTPGYSGSPPVHSEVYLFRSCPLVLYGSWLLIAEALDPNHTVVKVIPELTEVHNYRCFYIGHPWGCAIPVESTTIEEYRMLFSLGQCLGVRGMPNVAAPSGKPPDPAACEQIGGR
jgi:hypothetical protein